MSEISISKVRGFTIVELLIVIVVIAILAAISIIAYNGIQARARDAQRIQDIKTITKALELYYLDNGALPNSTCNLGVNCKINSAWNTTADASWSNLETQLVPKYISSLPKDPLASVTGTASIWGGYNYDYVTLQGSGTAWCDNSAARPFYLLSYRLESQSQKREIIGNCTGAQPSDYASSEYILTKN